MGRPPLREDGERMKYILSVRFRDEEVAYVEDFRKMVGRQGHTITRVMRDLLDAGLQQLSSNELLALCEKTAAGGERYVFRITHIHNGALDAMAREFTDEIGRRIFKVDVAARAVLLMANRRFKEFAKSGYAMPKSPLGLREVRTYQTMDNAPPVEG